MGNPYGEVQNLDVSTAAIEYSKISALFETIRLKPYTSITFVARIGANINGVSSAYWEFAGTAKRLDLPHTISLTGVRAIKVLADDEVFKETYIEITTNSTMGALVIKSGANPTNVVWDADVEVNQVA